MTNNIEINSSEDTTQINSWDLTKLKYVCKVENGSTPKSNIDEFWDDSLKWFTPNDFRNITNNFYLEIPNRFISQKGLENSGCSFIKEESILLTTRAPVGKVAKIKGGFTFNQGCKSLSPKNLDIGFLYYSLQNSEQFLKSLSRGTTFKELSTDELLNFKIHIPELKIQKLISKFLDKKIQTIDNLIKKIEKKIELLKEQKTALINQCVTKGLNPNVEKKDSGVEWIGKIPSHWQLLRLNNLGRFSKGKGITKDKIKVNGNKCIRCGEIYTTYELRFNRTRSFIDDDTSDESVLATKGVLLFTGDGESLEEIGKCIVYEGEEDLYIGGGINVFTPKQEKVIPIYLSYVMNSESVIYQKSRQGKGEIVVHIYSKQLKEIRLGLPSIKEQQQIVEYLDQKTSLIDKIISYENKRLLFLKEYKKSLISEVVTGKKRVV